ncbi:CHAP domain-containing protein [Lentzea tibetensis]|uniref:CHAP domain-containing protein n=1 Tax=Lentzea tibetensis TaxID=2591470 RepID=A0A563ELI3_9PSEU|nr:CHAP domain-containing protein [Lentzea tibetensis]TWP47960.1 CHAP domain-containing protein [Lentzea tibetensis]
MNHTTKLAVFLSAAMALPLLQPGTAAAGPLPPDCVTLRSCITDAAKGELNDSRTNREAGPNNCNFYSGYWGTSGDDKCGVINGYKFRSNQWCSDFARFVWKVGGARVTGLDPWAGSFYRAYRGRFHANGGGYVPAPGDAVLYDWDGSRPSLGRDGWDVDHVGIVTGYANGRLSTIEGNVSGGASRDGVFAKNRDTKRVVGYVSPLRR